MTINELIDEVNESIHMAQSNISQSSAEPHISAALEQICDGILILAKAVRDTAKEL